MWKLHASGHMLLFSFPHRKYLKRTHYTFPRSCKLPQGLPFPHFHTRNYCRPGNSTWDHSIPNHNMQHAHSNMPQKLVCNWQNSNEDINNSETNLFSILLPKLLSVSINEKKKQQWLQNRAWLFNTLGQPKDKYSNIFSMISKTSE